MSCRFYFRRDAMLKELIFFLVTFVFCFLGRFIIFLLSKKNRKKKKKSKKRVDKDFEELKKSGISIEILYLEVKYKIPKEKINNRKFGAIISLLDALIIAGTLSIVVNLAKNIIIRMILALVIFIVLIYVIYGILGKILVKKGYDKNEL